MFAKEEMKRRRMVRTPTSVLFVRDWIIFLVTFCKTAGKSWDISSKKNQTETELIPLVMLTADM